MSGFPIPSDSWLLMAVLASESPSPEWVAQRTPKQLPELGNFLGWAQDQGVSSLVESSLKTLASPPWPISRIEALASAHRRTETARWVAFEEATKEALAALCAGLEAPPLVIKGGALRYRLYPAPWYRPCQDLDLLVHPLAMRKAVELLERCGFVAEVSPGAPQELATAVNLDRQGIRIEVHSSLFSRYRPDASHEALLPRSLPLAPYPGARSPDLTGHFLMGVLHLIRHGFLFKLKDVADLDRIVRRQEVEWEFVQQHLQSLGLSTALEWTLAILEQLMGTPVPQQAWPAPQRLLSPRKAGRLLASPTRPEFWLAGRHLPLHAATALTLLACADSPLPLADATVDWTRRRLRWLKDSILK